MFTLHCGRLPDDPIRIAWMRAALDALAQERAVPLKRAA
jgi:hypothetical protein